MSHVGRCVDDGARSQKPALASLELHASHQPHLPADRLCLMRKVTCRMRQSCAPVRGKHAYAQRVLCFLRRAWSPSPSPARSSQLPSDSPSQQVSQAN